MLLGRVLEGRGCQRSCKPQALNGLWGGAALCVRLSVHEPCNCAHAVTWIGASVNVQNDHCLMQLWFSTSIPHPSAGSNWWPLHKKKGAQEGLNHIGHGNQEAYAAHQWWTQHITPIPTISRCPHMHRCCSHTPQHGECEARAARVRHPAPPAAPQHRAPVGRVPHTLSHR